MKSNIPRNPFLYHFLKQLLCVKDPPIFLSKSTRSTYPMYLLYTCSAFGHVKETFLLLHYCTGVLLPTNGKLDMNNNTLLSFHWTNRILSIGLCTYLISPCLQTLINSSLLIPSFPICTNCTTSQYLVLSLQHNKTFWCRISIIHEKLSESIRIVIQSGENIAFTTAVWVVRRCQRSWGIEIINMIDEIVSIRHVSKYT